MTLWVFSGNRPSESAANLSKMAGYRRMKFGKYVKNGDTIVNWGVKDENYFPLLGYTQLNSCKSVSNAINKLKAFELMAGEHVTTVPWTANKAVAKEWQDHGNTVVARKILTGCEGTGILIIEEGDNLIDAPLYSKYIFKSKEFRVHATRLKAFSTNQKIRDPSREPISWKVRSYKNGFIYKRNGIEPNPVRDALAVQAVVTLGLDFGAVDIVEDKHGHFYILEVNTAPGIEGQAVPIYADALKELANEAAP